ncbi:V-type ATP synthase subunit A [Petroclostridium sp. X23]|uniref:V-type ATP synthase subunit A n=1 Tax=Petroclostridium sp. X23 TaxID=3045146 RepID=UPI0024ADF307|nr:V-type ATP synthase subunit A [Petroclostridium sp. X23]WHH61677.1 V-type ATP synthase subunit A [Petroclostridium sp. X23]
MEAKGVIFGINGPVIKVKGSKDFRMYEMVMVGNEKLIGEVIAIHNDMTIVQVYEVTTGLTVGEPVISTGKPLSVQLAPGIIGNIFDGIERPLHYIEKKSGDFISRGIAMESLDPEKEWFTHITVKVGDQVMPGSIIAEVQETPLILHKVMIPPNMSGEVVEVMPDGNYSLHQTIIRVQDKTGSINDLTLVQEWPIRIPRRYLERKSISRPLITGQRVIDTFFPIAKGGTAAIPGGFGTGKTMTQHQLAKWSDADIIVYIGCGERGNEMTEVLEDFPKLVDPKSNQPLMNRTVLIANTSNMPVAAREASIYTGITLAEYYRDMGYHVAIMADSTSRWAEALREISGRLEEMPAEEGFPAYLPSRLSEFYERAGYVYNLNGTEGSVTIIGAVSPQGGDFSEPVTQNTKRFIRCFWALDRQLAYSRHYPAIHWLTSYSEYIDNLQEWYQNNVHEKFFAYRTQMVGLLQEESKLMDIVKLIGADILPDEQKLILDISRVIRLGFLQQNAYHASDTYVPAAKQFKMMETILELYNKSKILIQKNIPVSVLRNTGIFDDLIKIKYTIGNEELEKFDEIHKKIDAVYNELKEKYK